VTAGLLTALFGELPQPVDATRNPKPFRRTRSRRPRAPPTSRIPGARVGSGRLSRRNGGSARRGGSAACRCSTRLGAHLRLADDPRLVARYQRLQPRPAARARQDRSRPGATTGDCRGARRPPVCAGPLSSRTSACARRAASTAPSQRVRAGLVRLDRQGQRDII